MIYVWQCDKCKKEIEIDCKIADRNNLPDEKCCGDFKRMISSTNTWVRGYSAKNGYANEY